MVDDLVAIAIELVGQQLLRKRHTHRIGQALPQRPSGGFHAGTFAKLRVARSGRVQLTKRPDVCHGDVVAAQV